MSKKVYCIAEFAPKAGCEQQFFELLTSLEPHALREDGCVRYRVTRQIQHPTAPSQSKFSIMFNEEWASIEAFELHAKQQYLIDFFGKYVENPQTSLVDDASVRIFSDEI
jgi:quinol monooxygenase YgiN